MYAVMPSSGAYTGSSLTGVFTARRNRYVHPRKETNVTEYRKTKCPHRGRRPGNRGPDQPTLPLTPETPWGPGKYGPFDVLLRANRNIAVIGTLPPWLEVLWLTGSITSALRGTSWERPTAVPAAIVPHGGKRELGLTGSELRALLKRTRLYCPRRSIALQVTVQVFADMRLEACFRPRPPWRPR